MMFWSALQSWIVVAPLLIFRAGVGNIGWLGMIVLVAVIYCCRKRAVVKSIVSIFAIKLTGQKAAKNRERALARLEQVLKDFYSAEYPTNTERTAYAEEILTNLRTIAIVIPRGLLLVFIIRSAWLLAGSPSLRSIFS
ncbi:MAG: hypothetical protein FWC79_06725 [Oscillospiraceae bacterium]|nr:hypothetical protein [Oscillospiraceae bacterium]